jgi:hypothetical protein
MKYYRAVDKNDTTRVLYISINDTLETYEDLPEQVVLEESGYLLTECSQKEFDRMSSNVNDYIINVGNSRDDLEPFESAHTSLEAIERARELGKEYSHVEVVYMPESDVDINEIIWSWYEE